MGQLPGVIHIFLEFLWKLEPNIQKERPFLLAPKIEEL